MQEDVRSSRNRLEVASASVAPSPLSGASASDKVFYGIVNGLEIQAFVPGQRLVESDLAAMFDVGRNSVREALQRLAAEGFVEIFRHKGAAVRMLSPQDTLDVLDVAERMTGLLARSAANNASRSELAPELQICIKDLIASDAAQDIALFAKARRRFYRLLLEMSGSRELRRLFPAIQMPIVLAQYRLPGLQKLRLGDYRSIAAAVAKGNAETAELAGTAHVQHVRDHIVLEMTRRDAYLLPSSL